MKIARITAKEADYAKKSGIEQSERSFSMAMINLKYLVSLDYTLVRAMQDTSVPITDNLRDTKDLLRGIAENIGEIHNIKNRLFESLKYFEHPVRVRVETSSAQEFDQIVFDNKDSILSDIDIKDVRVGDAVDFVMYDSNLISFGTRVRLSRVYLDDNHIWVSAYDEPYVTGWKASLSDPHTTFNLPKIMN